MKKQTNKQTQNNLIRCNFHNSLRKALHEPSVLPRACFLGQEVLIEFQRYFQCFFERWNRMEINFEFFLFRLFFLIIINYRLLIHFFIKRDINARKRNENSFYISLVLSAFNLNILIPLSRRLLMLSIFNRRTSLKNLLVHLISKFQPNILKNESLCNPRLDSNIVLKSSTIRNLLKLK